VEMMENVPLRFTFPTFPQALLLLNHFYSIIGT